VILADVASWFGSGAAIVASAVALVAYLSTVADKRQHQAGQVFGQVTSPPAPIPPGVPEPGGFLATASPHARLLLTFIVENGSQEPATDLRIFMLDRDNHATSYSSGPWDLIPGERVRPSAVAVMLDNGKRGGERLVLEFTDAGGRRWRRRAGQVSRIYCPRLLLWRRRRALVRRNSIVPRQRVI
jgi:hypothetical protein